MAVTFSIYKMVGPGAVRGYFIGRSIQEAVRWVIDNQEPGVHFRVRARDTLYDPSYGTVYGDEHVEIPAGASRADVLEAIERAAFFAMCNADDNARRYRGVTT